MRGMEEIVKLLDENLEYVKHEVSGDRITIWVKSAKKEVICPYCGKPSKKVHSRYERSFQDLPIQGKKTTIVVIRRKMFCENKECKKKTLAEPLDFVEPKFKRTKRLELEKQKIRTLNRWFLKTKSWFLLKMKRQNLS